MLKNSENKAKLFGQYIRQIVWVKPSVYGYDAFPVNPEMLYEPSDEEYLLLKPLSSITDEDRLWIAKQSAYRVDDKNIKAISDSMISHLLEFNSWAGSSILYMTDYLRSKGYALPYLGLPVKKQIEYGWIKLVES